MDIFSQKELILMIGVVGTLLLVVTILTILDIRDYLKSKKIEDFENIEDNQNVEIKIEDVSMENDLNLPEVEVLDFNDEEKTQIDFIEEMPKEEIVFENSDTNDNYFEVEVSPKKINIMEELENAEKEVSLENTIYNFEQQQEDTAIISLDELLKRSNELYDSNEIMQYDDGNEPITIDEVMQKYNSNSIVDSSNYVSNMYGVETNEMQFENTATYEKLSRENDKDFLTKLREVSEEKN